MHKNCQSTEDLSAIRHLWLCTFPRFTIHFKRDKDERWIRRSQLKAGLYLTYTSILFTLLCAQQEQGCYTSVPILVTRMSFKRNSTLAKDSCVYFFLFNPCFVLTRTHTYTAQYNADSSVINQKSGNGTRRFSSLLFLSINLHTSFPR